jgi:hypothetical protein
LREYLSYPEIEFIEILLNIPRKAGKSYQKIEEKNIQYSYLTIKKKMKNAFMV